MSQQAANMANQNAQSCHLLHVPAEIFDRITWHLTTPELCSLRLTCKSVEEALYFRFTAEFFTRKQFMVSEFSLQALVDISKSRLSGCLRQVHIGLDQVDAASSPWMNIDLKQVHLYQQRLIEQGSLWTLGLVPKYLAEAFANLPSLESVVVRDFNSSRRSRDGPYTHWLSYGTKTMYNETSVRPITPSFHGWTNPIQQDYSGRLFKAVIHALGMAKAKPTTIEVMERHGNLLFDSAFHIYSGSEADVIPVLRGLKRLHLCLDVTLAVSMSSHNSQTYHQFQLAKFLRHCDELEELRINGKRNNQLGARVSLKLLFEWLAATESAPLPAPEVQKEAVPSPLAHQATSGTLLLHAPRAVINVPPPPPAKLARLENISLGMMSLTVDEIVPLIARFAGTLQHLELWRIQLLFVEKDVDSDLPDDRPILVVRLLKKLLNIPNLNLRHIKLGNLLQGAPHPRRELQTRDIYFKPTAKTTDDEVEADANLLTKFLEYTGTDWRHFVAHEMIPRLYTPRTKDAEEEIQDEDVDDEDDEDDENDDNDDNDDADGMDQDEEP